MHVICYKNVKCEQTRIPSSRKTHTNAQQRLRFFVHVRHWMAWYRGINVCMINKPEFKF
jgi:hypothetical protein